MASIEFNPNRFFSPGFELTVFERKKEGKISPKTYSIKVPVDYCPFCGEKLEIKEHPKDCDCISCEIERDASSLMKSLKP